MHSPSTVGATGTGPAPLVEPGAPLAPERIARFSRQLMLPGFGELAQRRLAAARVLVVGAGGLGSALVPYLAGAGVGTIGIVDDDTVELSNLHRQVSHGVGDLGRLKVDSLAETVTAIDPDCRVVRHPVRLTAANIGGILAGYDVLVDGSDNFPTRYLTNDAAVLAGVPLVWGAILRFHGQAGLSWHEHGPTYRDLFPVPPAPDEVLSCELGGVLPSVCATIGSLMATEVVKLVTGVGELLLGRVVTIDALSGRSREIAYEAIADAPEITTLIDYEGFCGLEAPGEAGTVGDAALAASAPVRVSSAELLRRIRSGEPLRLVDVREPREAELRSIRGSELFPLGEVTAGGGPELGDAPIVVYCERDLRSRRAARLLLERGHSDVVYLAGGIEEFAAVAADLVRR
ncbi:ThiF family adenylyltransferase [Agromyces ramosus]|uniref:Molybdopterin/thiamine biosynthesis adenylyltransferase/rhodanese-related sulfurtransferase n=1 Tax=Agromyces ramosus TaxID=33879 RepID=A0ABU0RAV5_9MICO|nr:ThiF family adenylyltransferase [Agromyces ramosus]MDQ0895206.1 molybdopterin/thiamine biosynthesis adenylyltransferase/rhodanese-related sulfurtransferase [Agromyces ramosus]